MAHAQYVIPRHSDRAAYIRPPWHATSGGAKATVRVSQDHLLRISRLIQFHSGVRLRQAGEDGRQQTCDNMFLLLEMLLGITSEERTTLSSERVENLPQHVRVVTTCCCQL